MQENLSVSNTFASSKRSTSLIGASSLEPAEEMVFDDAALQSSPRPVHADSPSLERLHILLAELFDAMSHALQDERGSAEECIRRARVILRISLSASAATAAQRFANARAQRIRGGLAPWQIRRVTTYIDANLDATIGIKDLAALAKLSYFHFCRAFRGSFGETPHGYLMRRRVERAQGLLLTTNASLGEIAAECGCSDQAHFTKLFHRFVGESPGAWRRTRATAPTP
jgi:AraC-like DNA-binding protein